MRNPKRIKLYPVPLSKKTPANRRRWETRAAVAMNITPSDISGFLDRFRGRESQEEFEKRKLANF